GMYAVMQQMNVAYDVEEGRPFLRARATALGLTLLFAVLVLGAFSLVVLGGVIQDWLGRRFGFGDPLLAFFVVFRWVVIVFALLVALAFIYFAAPNRRQRFALFTPGTLVATVLLVVATLGFKLYVTGFANYDATYGSIGAVIVLMLWLYIVGLVMLAGAEINALLARRRAAGRASPAADAGGVRRGA
ncbi:MAG TPA: YihY/virulence factor BrkB family protein, partial [Casimicrobiaceae bacterium]|nr:YihY/virulence factor BrkB family protein [Casimicrobiaceae bacterium]